MRDLFRGELVRLSYDDPEARAKAEVRWQRDTEYRRLVDSDPADLVSEKRTREWIEKRLEDGFKPERYYFNIHTLDDDRLIGFLSLWMDLIHGEVLVGVGIGEREFWNKGFGTDTMKLCLQYAFTELNAHRVSLGLHEYNPRALRTYEKAGFRLEGRTRQDMMREGRRNDSLWMGVLREEWLGLDTAAVE
jgi:RimJ/RimL family protein N-acetyltransferase